jgi:predicted nucleic-acid-binding protein
VTGLDTNVLVRFLTEDDPAQAERAAALMATLTATGQRAFISPVVLVEMSWVLRVAYEVSKADLLVTLDRLLATEQFVIGEKDVVREALAAYRKGRAEFADYLIGAIHRANGCERTVTFDRRLRGDTHFQML